MYSEIIAGGIGSGKSSYLYNCIIKNLSEHPGSEAILIVPEQFSYTAEKTLLEAMGGLGLNNIEVLTFSRLCYRYLKPKNTILPSGKMILVQKAVSDMSENNMFYLSSHRDGFTEAMAELFSELKRYGVTSEDFSSVSVDNEFTAQKLSSVNEIYKAYTDYLSEDFFDSDDSIALLAEYISASEEFKNTYIYIDDYNDFMPQHYLAIRSFLSCAKGVYITLGMDFNKNSDLFSPTLRTHSRLTELSKELGTTPKLTNLEGNADYIKAPDIRFLLENWDIKPDYPEKSTNISVFNALDIYSEVEHTASQIISLVRDFGYRFRDIGIICGDTDAYLYLISSIFKDYEIPFFADEKISVSMQPIAKTILSLFDIISENWSYNSVFSYLRLGYIYEKTEDGITAISQEDIDLLENYVLLHGIKGKKAWFNEWTQNGETVFDDVINNYSREESDLELLNSLRVKIITPFMHFLDNKGRTAKAIAEAVFNFMCDINLYDGLLLECEHFDAIGMRNESEQFRQTWNTVMEALDQLVTVLGKGSVSREDFSEYLSCGLSGSQISIIPSGLDRVSIGNISRNSPSRVKVLFILGASEGKIPQTVSEGAILSDFDRTAVNEALSKFNKELAPDNLRRIALENLKLYRTLSTATERLFISCPASDIDGNPLSFSHFILDLIEMFDLKVSDNIISKPTADELITSAKHGFYYLLLRLSQYYKDTPEKIWKSVYDWYAKNPDYRDRLGILKNAAAYKKIQPTLSRIKAEMLYGKNKKYSITALEEFERCPFSYYLEKGLKLRAQEEKRIEKSHIGSLVHAAVCEFCHLVEDGASSISEIHQKWCELTAEQSDAYIHSVMKSIKEKVLSRATYDVHQLEYLLSRCETTLINSVRTVRKSLAGGKYTAICYEKDFEVDIDWKKDKVTLIGTIDRIDVMEDLIQNKLNIRIVDYKSGRKDFSLTAVCDKVDMQLILYAVAASKMAHGGNLNCSDDKPTQITALLYSKIHEQENSEISEQDAENFDVSAASSEEMDGLFILDRQNEDDENAPFDTRQIIEMDSSLTSNQKSEFLHIKLNTDGSFDKRSSRVDSRMVSKEQFEIMSRYIRKAVIDADKKIKSGFIEIKPYRSDKASPCTYCKFGEICMFDARLDGYRRPCEASRWFEVMEKEVSENEQN